MSRKFNGWGPPVVHPPGGRLVPHAARTMNTLKALGRHWVCHNVAYCQECHDVLASSLGENHIAESGTRTRRGLLLLDL